MSVCKVIVSCFRYSSRPQPVCVWIEVDIGLERIDFV